MNNYDKDVASKWTRYPESFVETIIDETLKLLTLSASEAKFGVYLTPMHFISLIDVQANWFSKWMVK